MHILALSLDADGCFFNDAYYHSDSPNRIVEANELFFAALEKQLKEEKFDRIIFLVGSNRQSQNINLCNMCDENSCFFSEMQKIVDEITKRTEIPCELERILAADIYGNMGPGENYTKAVNKEKKGFAEFIWDESKYSLTYLQMHKLASENKKAKITYQFYDNEKSIQHSIIKFMDENKELFPSNVKRRSYLYKGKELKEFRKVSWDDKEYDFEMQGEGVIDGFYWHNIKEMARSCGFDSNQPHRRSPYGKGISELLHGKALENFKNNRRLRAKDICFELNYEIRKIYLTCKNNYPTEELALFVENLRYLRNVIVDELSKETLKEFPASELLNNKAVRMAKATLRMLRKFSENNIERNEYFNFEREKALNEYINNYGQSNSIIWRTARSVSNSIYNLFYTPPLHYKYAYEVAKSLKKFHDLDVKEYQQMEEASAKKRLAG